MLEVNECRLCKKIALSYRDTYENKCVCINCILLKCCYYNDGTTLFNDSDPDSTPCLNCLYFGFFDMEPKYDECNNGICSNCIESWKENGSPVINNNITTENYNKTVNKLREWDISDWICSWNI